MIIKKIDELQVNWNQPRPSEKQAIDIWNSIRIEPNETWTAATELFKNKINETHSNGGIQLHKYKLSGNAHFRWFYERNRLDEIDFLNNILITPELSNYRKDLKVGSPADIVMVNYNSDGYSLPGKFARILGYGGAYHHLDSQTAWNVATEFIREEFQNRFDELLVYNFAIKNANWFFDIAWDCSMMLFNKRNCEIIFIDITDTD